MRFFNVETGELLSRKVGVPAHALAANTPKGYRPIAGDFDHRTQRVDVDVLAVAGDDADPADFVVERADADERRQLRQDELSARAARAEIINIERSGSRAMREALIELLPDGHPLKQRIKQDDDAIAALRPRIQSTRTEGRGE